jgi:GNAT superfamily N-acetyltransferase
MRLTEIRTVDQAEQARATSIQLMAFSSDPVMRWVWPEADAYVRHFPGFVRGFGGRAFEKGTAHVTADFHGGDLWLPPGVGPDAEALEALIGDTVTGPARSEVGPILEQMSEAHPHEPHWHLALIGVDPVWHGQGIGAALLRYALERIDEQGLQAYLESSNPRNIPLYQRHGFEVIREIRVGGSPPVTPMLRVPR